MKRGWPRAGVISAGTASIALGALSLSNANGVSFGMTGSTLTASVNPSTVSHLFMWPDGGATSPMPGVIR